jgi:FAD/FMN-containing dehydrogenase
MRSTREVLRRQFGGEIIEPGAVEYESASRSLFAVGRPACVLRPHSVSDVQVAVRYAVEAGLVLSVRGGGHGFPGFATNDGGVVIDLSRLAAVELVDRARHIVRIGGGATWGEVAAGLAPHGLAISAGDTRSVGVGGLTLAGGIGWKVRKYGLALDQLLGAEIVIADGTVVHATAQDDPELFWAVRGGGGNFGVVTAFEFMAHPTTEVFSGRITFPASETARVLQGWADHLRSAPDELTSVVTLANPANGGPQAPVEVGVVFDGDVSERAAEAIDPIRRLGTVIDDDIEPRAYDETLADGATPPPGIRFLSRSGFVDRSSVPEALQLLAETAVSPGSPAIGVRSVTGAASRVPVDATAYAHRRAELMIVTLAAGPAPAIDAAERTLDSIWRALTPHVTGAYGSFLSSASAADVAAIYPPETFRRLAVIKREYDPGNVFASNHNVPPSACTRPDAHGSSSAQTRRASAPRVRRPVVNESTVARQ